ncbi:TIGR01459 family HAD-type hydrolase [Candidatus Paracaedibacter symbiosus]|uniref:TIGR01459 family HAD-type hydrolase n=1 Tax=Candidatus Paracaedibacter symbiosus TaxID=244582 RepID=UPI0018DC2D53|nr:TIGR01459 family HAD-type hydrolase [Candidatus Paracaedibacter symbiosus]
MVQSIQKLRAIANDYEVFIIDLWGVIHNGIKVFLPAIEALEHLKKAGKIVYLVTNNPKTSAENIVKLTGMGLSCEFYTEMISAGQKCLEMFLNNEILPDRPRPLRALILEEGLACTWDKVAGLTRVPALCDADIILGFHIAEEIIDMSNYKSMLEEALGHNILFVCSNPDMYATRNNERFARVGLLARTYEQMGGPVIYVGKPYPSIYEEILEKHRNKRILMIGDSLITDIKGANQMGFDGMLVSMGNHKEELSKVPSNELQNFFIRKGIVPTFLCPQLLW